MVYFKKFFSCCLSFFLVFSSIPFVFASPNIDTYTGEGFYINSSIETQTVKPGETIDISASVEVTGGNVTNLKFHLNIPASGFVYNGGGKTDLWYEPEILALTTSDWNPPSQNSVFVTNSHNASEYDYIDIYNIPLQVSQNISSYSNTISGNFSSTEVTGASVSRQVFVDIKPHIISANFSPSSLANNGVSTTTLTVEVQDFNGCSNIQGGSVTANLTPLGGTYSTLEPLTYISCTSENIATFQKTNIITNASAGTKDIILKAVDADLNQNDPSDPYFGSIDLINSTVSLTVNQAEAPEITDISLSKNFVGENEDFTLSFTGSLDTEEHKIVLGSSSDCSSGTILKDWTLGGSGGNLFGINASSLEEGINTLSVCVANSERALMGSNFITITKDITPPVLTNHFLSPTNITTENPVLSFSSAEAGEYQIRVGSGSFSSLTAYSTSGVNTPATYSNAWFSVGENTIELKFIDKAGNTSSLLSTVTKTTPPPSMSGKVLSLEDGDNIRYGLDGRDFTVSFTPYTDPYDFFEAYWIYILPEGVPLNTETHLQKGTVYEKETGEWTGLKTMKTDSAQNPLESGNYKAYVLIMSSAGVKGESGNVLGIVSSDILTYAHLESASFTGNTLLQLKYDVPLSETISDHNGLNIVSPHFEIYSSCNGNNNGVYSISGQYISFCILPLNNVSKTALEIGGEGTNMKDAVKAQGGGYNCYASETTDEDMVGCTQADKDIPITDKQAPNPLVIGTVAVYQNSELMASYEDDVIDADIFLSELQIDYSLPEDMDTSTELLFTQTGGTADPLSPHSISLSSDQRKAGSYTVSFDTSVLQSGAEYSLTLQGKDIAGNSGTPYIKTGIRYDSTPPSQVVSVPYPNNLDETKKSTSETLPTFSWFSSEDNESGLAGYRLQLSLSSSFDPVFFETTLDSSLTEYTLETPLSGDPAEEYFWRIQALDVAGNESLFSTDSQGNPRNFIVDDSVPAISNIQVSVTAPQQKTNTNFITASDVLSLAVALGNGNSECMYADLSALKTGALEILPESYENGTAIFLLDAVNTDIGSGLKTMTVFAKNASCTNDEYTSLDKTLTVDVTDPVITSGFTSLTGGEILAGGKNFSLAWTPASIVETNFESLTLSVSYDSGNTFETLVQNLSNSGSFTWSVPSINSETVRLQLQAFDKVGRTGEFIMDTDFSVDSLVPALESGLFVFPSGGERVKSETRNIAWTPGKITDTHLKATPISFWFSENNGTSYSLLSENQGNTGEFSWNIPEVNTSSAKIKLCAFDTAENTACQESSAFVIDSIAPTISSIKTADLDFDGKIDAFLIQFSENIADSSVNVSHFSISGYENIGFSSFTGGLSPNNTEIYLTVSEQLAYDSGETPTLEYTKGTLQDTAGNLLESVSFSSEDKVNPLLISAESIDSDTNGKLNAVKLIFSEPIAESSILPSAVTVHGYENIRFETGFLENPVNTNTVYLQFNEKEGFNTGEEILLSFGTGAFADMSGNTLVGKENIVLENTVSPVLVETFTLDLSENGKLDAVKLVFSEPISDISVEASNFVFSNEFVADLLFSETYQGKVFVNGFATGGASDDTIVYIKLQEALDYNTGASFTVSVPLNSFTDTVGNFNQVSEIITQDLASPVMITAELFDTNSTGEITKATITFSEKLEESSVQALWFSLENIPAESFAVNENSQENLLDFFFSSVYGTEEKPFTYSPGTVTDMNGNALLAKLDFLEIQDTAGPVLVSASYREGETVASDELVFVFSESVDDTTLSVSDFTITGGGSISSAIFHTGTTANDEQVSFLLTETDTRLLVGVSSVSFAGQNLVFDKVSPANGNTHTSAVLVSGAVVINEILWAGSSLSNTDFYLELRNMSSTALDISHWILENASESSENIILSEGSTIAENGYFLISRYAKGDARTSITVDADFVTADLFFAGSDNGIIALKNNEGVLLDSVNGNVFSAGEGGKSQERKRSPGLGENALSWYTATARENLVLSTSRGTPKSQNILDSTPPTLNEASLFPTPSLMLPQMKEKLWFEASDSESGIESVKLYKDSDQNTGTSGEFFLGCESFVSDLSSDTARYVYEGSGSFLAGRNRYCVKITDIAGNETQYSWDFIADDIRFSTEEVENSLLHIVPGEDLETALVSTRVVIETYGAGFSLQGISDTMKEQGGENEISHWDGEKGAGVRIQGGEVTTLAGVCAPVSIAPSSYTSLENNPVLYEREASSFNGTVCKRRFVFDLQYTIRIDEMQSTGNYVFKPQYGVKIQY